MSGQPMTATQDGPNLLSPPRCGRVAASRPDEYKMTALSAIRTWFVRTSRSPYIHGAGAHVNTLGRLGDREALGDGMYDCISSAAPHSDEFTRVPPVLHGPFWGIGTPHEGAMYDWPSSSSGHSNS